jgi:hypothetical protein
MAFRFNQWFSRNPYTSASIAFMVLALVGWQLLDWGERQFGFLLLLYFILTLGIRLDEICRAIGGSRSADGEPESLAAQLREIRRHLRRIQAALDTLPGRDDAGERREP